MDKDDTKKVVKKSTRTKKDTSKKINELNETVKKTVKSDIDNVVKGIKETAIKEVEDLTNKQFGLLKVIEYVYTKNNKKYRQTLSGGWLQPPCTNVKNKWEI